MNVKCIKHLKSLIGLLKWEQGAMYTVTMPNASRHEYHSAGLCLQGRNQLCVFTVKSYQQLTFSYINVTTVCILK